MLLKIRARHSVIVVLLLLTATTSANEVCRAVCFSLNAGAEAAVKAEDTSAHACCKVGTTDPDSPAINSFASDPMACCDRSDGAVVSKASRVPSPDPERLHFALHAETFRSTALRNSVSQPFRAPVERDCVHPPDLRILHCSLLR